MPDNQSAPSTKWCKLYISNIDIWSFNQRSLIAMFSAFDFITVPTFLISWFPLDVGRFSNIGDGGVEDPGTKKII